MTGPWIIEPIYILEDRPFGLALGCPAVGPNTASPHGSRYRISRPSISLHGPSDLVLGISKEVLIQQAGCDVEGVISVGGNLLCPVPDDLDAILLHEAAHAPVPKLQARLLQFFDYAPRFAFIISFRMF